jgi:tryptophan synthase alpha chain
MVSGLATTSSEASAASQRPGTTRSIIEERFATLRKAGRRAFVPYITAGDPSVSGTVDLLKGLEDAGADTIEVGVPFSDPMADGPVIRLSTPVVLSSYLNPIIAAGNDVLDRGAQSGCHGVLITDLPVGADQAREEWLGRGPLAFIRLVAPTTPADRMREIGTHGSGFVYLISRLGVTGVQESLAADLPQTIARLRSATTLPICVGFGVSRPDQAIAVAKLADGVVVGSAIVRAAAESVPKAIAFAREMRAAIDQA